MSEFIPIREFARRVGVTPQAIYQRVEKDLAIYCKTVEGKKMISIDALDSIKQVDQSLNQLYQELDKELMNVLSDTIKTLNEQLEQKDKQINELNERLKESIELNRNNQVLIKQEQNQNVLLLESSLVRTRKQGWFTRYFQGSL